LKISIGAKIFEGPWGGGNLFVKNISNYLKAKGHKVVYELKDDDIDIILLTDPRKNSESSSFTHKEIKKYLKKINSNAKVVHRINECDERKNTRGVNSFYIKANKISNFTIFVSQWLKDIYIKSGYVSKNDSVILAGADSEIFNRDKLAYHKNGEKFKIVTHHWSNNWNKGFSTYDTLDRLLNNESFNSKYEFTYIGNLPKKYSFKNTNVINPLDGVDLANELKKHHIYLTASLNEPSGNHHIEAAQCGLPILYINSGGIPEYCDGYGVEFTEDNFQEKLLDILENYEFFRKSMQSYPNNSDKMSKEFLNVFENLIE
jgi:glycosyltransferase involved in cell wall biosynthesis